MGLKHQTEADKAAAAKAKKDAKDREDAELKLLFAQLQSGATKKQKAAEAAQEVGVWVCVGVGVLHWGGVHSAGTR